MKAIILAAGVGSRLHPLTQETPKTLIEISGKPIVERIFESLPEEIDEVVLVVEHLKERVKAHLGNNFNNRKIIYVNQGDKKGTFGALLSAREFVNDDEFFLVLNGDDLHSKNELSQFLNNGRALGVQRAVMPNYYSVVVNSVSFVEKFRPQTEKEKIFGTLIATGVYVLDSEIFKQPGVVVYGGEYGLPQTILAQKDDFPIKAIVTEKWVPINSFADIERANKLW
ncbi:MAG: NDP-sugar synthase [Candidatus Zambryskibacteria bacterium]|nr:NDP-sugar synthase [Candidatus Zambryskibacteria bacterium]